MNYKKIINILAWLAIFILLFAGYRIIALNSLLTWDRPFSSVVYRLFLPIGILFILINSISKKDYQASLVLVAVLISTIFVFFEVKEKYNNPPTPPPRSEALNNLR